MRCNTRVLSLFSRVLFWAGRGFLGKYHAVLPFGAEGKSSRLLLSISRSVVVVVVVVVVGGVASVETIFFRDPMGCLAPFWICPAAVTPSGARVHKGWCHALKLVFTPSKLFMPITLTGDQNNQGGLYLAQNTHSNRTRTLETQRMYQ